MNKQEQRPKRKGMQPILVGKALERKLGYDVDKKPERRGRRKGVKNKILKEARELLREYRPELVKKAIELALKKKNPNIPVLLKLLDKVVPTLTENTDLVLPVGFEQLTDAEIVDRIKEFNKYLVPSKTVNPETGQVS